MTNSENFPNKVTPPLILVVEDDKDVRDVLGLILASLLPPDNEHNITTVGTATEAREVLLRNPAQNFALIDVALGHELGTELARQCVKRETVPLLMTGYNSVGSYFDDLGVPHILKPMRMAPLIQLVEQMLDEPAQNLKLAEVALLRVNDDEVRRHMIARSPGNLRIANTL